MARIRLPSISKEQMYHQLLDAMDTELRSRVRPHISIRQDWKKTKDVLCEYDASIQEEKLDRKPFQGHGHEHRQSRPQSQYKPRTNQSGRSNASKPWTQPRKPQPRQQSTWNNQPKRQQPRTNRQSNTSITCYNCGKRGHYAKDCRSAPMQSAAATITQEHNQQPQRQRTNYGNTNYGNKNQNNNRRRNN